MRFAPFRTLARLGMLCAAVVAALAALTQHMLFGIHHNHRLKSTTLANGGVKPLALAIAPATAGVVCKGDVLIDQLNQFTTHIGSALFACPGGVQEGDYVGSRLFSSA